jgi:hypothetical protein
MRCSLRYFVLQGHAQEREQSERQAGVVRSWLGTLQEKNTLGDNTMHALRKRRQRTSCDPSGDLPQTIDVDFTGLVGTVLGCMRRQYGLLACEEDVRIATVVERCSDLAVADRIAWIYAGQDHAQYVVFELDGWFWVGTPKSTIPPDQLDCVTPNSSQIRLMSVVSERGIVPMVGAGTAAAS